MNISSNYGSIISPYSKIEKSGIRKEFELPTEGVNIPKTSFIDHLQNGIDQVNASQKHSDQKSNDLVTGKEQNIHETMLAATQAELNFNLMVQVRNKALEAYQEVMRMPV